MVLSNPASTIVSPTPPSDLPPLETQVLTEALQQVEQASRMVHRSFYASLGMAIGSTVVSLVGVVLLLSGHASEGSITTASGLISGVGAAQLRKESGDRLDDANQRLDKLLTLMQEQRETLTDGAHPPFSAFSGKDYAPLRNPSGPIQHQARG